MKLLFDTHLLLWAALDERLSRAARELIGAPGAERVFSAASIWEIAIKSARRRADFPIDPVAFRRGLLGNGYAELPITGEHAVAVARLPDIHRDPFDRLLVAQAMVEAMPLVTSDSVLTAYGGDIRLV